MFKVFARTRGLIALIIFFCLLLICFLWYRLVQHTSADRSEAIDIAIQKNANLAVSLEQFAIRTILNANAVLQLVSMEFEKKDNKINFSSLINKGVIDEKYFHNVAIIDKKGKLQFSNLDLHTDS